jgi:enoyl-CoA hydratase
MSYELFTVERRANAAVVTINRPEKLNVMNATFFSELPEILGSLAREGDAHAVVLTGAGRAFSAGGDMEAFLEVHHDIVESRRYLRLCFECFAAVEAAELPVIAAVNGLAYGGGAELVLACDLAIASSEARFAFREAAVGLMPAFAVVRAPAVIGAPATRWLTYTAESIDATEAQRIGLVQRVVPDALLLDEALAVAGRIAANGPIAVRVAKQFINRSGREGLNEAIEATAMLYTTDDHKEGVAAFVEKRAPTFRGR